MLWLSREGFRCVECRWAFCRPCGIKHFSTGKTLSREEVDKVAGKLFQETTGFASFSKVPRSVRSFYHKIVRAAAAKLQRLRNERMRRKK